MSQKNVDVGQILNQCVIKEKQIPLDSPMIEFVDRIRECLAPIRDSHLSIETSVPMPSVLSGLTLHFDAQTESVYIAQIHSAIFALRWPRVGFSLGDAAW